MSVVDSIILHSLTRFQVYLRRNCEGEVDPEGDIWAAPYRWGCMVIAYKTNSFQKHKLAPIEVCCFLLDFVKLRQSIYQIFRLDYLHWNGRTGQIFGGLILQGGFPWWTLLEKLLVQS